VKAKLIVEREITHPDLKSTDDLKRLIHLQLSGQINGDEFRRRARVVGTVGTVIDHPDAWRLVEMGIAEPFDQECLDRVDANKLKKLERLAQRAEKLEYAQATGITALDATAEQVKEFKNERAEKRSKMSAVGPGN
jgi:hypothetical protein